MDARLNGAHQAPMDGEPNTVESEVPENVISFHPNCRLAVNGDSTGFKEPITPI